MVKFCKYLGIKKKTLTHIQYPCKLKEKLGLKVTTCVGSERLDGCTATLTYNYNDLGAQSCFLYSRKREDLLEKIFALIKLGLERKL